MIMKKVMLLMFAILFIACEKEAILISDSDNENENEIINEENDMIEKPLNVFEIANQLGYYEYAPHPVTGQTVRKVDVGRLCTHANINMWAKYKPVAFESVNALTDTERASVDWGFRAFSYPTYQEAAASGWTYKKPMGGKSEPFRLADFEKYNHEAQPFVTSVPQDVTVSNQIPQMFELGIDLNASDFELVDFSGNIGSFYYGIVFVKGDSKYIQTAKFAFGLGEGSILVETTHPFFTLGGTIEANHILVNQKIEEFTLLSNIVNDAPTYISLPTAEGVSNISTITAIPASTRNIEITKVGINTQSLTDVSPYAIEGGEKYLSSKAVYVQIDIKNNSNSVITLENMSMSATPTYFNSDGYSYPANMFDILGDPINIFTIPQNSSRKVIIGIDNILNTDEGIVPTVPKNLKIFSNIRIYNKGVLFTSKKIGFKSSLEI